MSGKTEWAENWVSCAQNRVRVSWTDIMATLGRKSRDRRVMAYEAATHIMVQAMLRGCDVVIDECNLYPPAFTLFMSRAQMLGAVVEWKTMTAGVDECKRRNALAGHPVADMEIERMAHDYGEWLKKR